MNEQGNQVHILDYQEDLPVRENQQEEFITAMNRARREDAPLQVFQDLLNDAPPVSLEDLYFLTGDFIRKHTDVVRLLLEHEPKIARHKDPLCHLLLHRAIRSYNASVDTIELILDAYPEAISEKDINGLLPFHYAYQYGQCIDALELLLSRFPDAASVSVCHEDQSRHQLPLHYCLQQVWMNRSDSFMLTLIEAYPEAASIKTWHNNWTALHSACEIGFSLAIVQRLYQLYPEAVSTQAGDDRIIPLHFACQAQKYFARSSLEVIKFLLEKYPEGSQSRVRSGQLPLHYAAQRHVIPLKLIQMLIEAYPDGVNVTDNSEKLPLHTACGAGAPLEVIQLLLDHYAGDEQHNNGLNITDDNGCLPIHFYARSQNARSDTLQHLLDLYPDGIDVVDNEGMLPLHWACSSIPARLDIIRILVEAAPFTVIHKSTDGRTPLQSLQYTHRRRLRRNVKVGRYSDAVTYLIQRQNEAVSAMKEAFSDVASTQLGLPDLVIANVWTFSKPDL